jgi:hypothetical protein
MKEFAGRIAVVTGGGSDPWRRSSGRDRFVAAILAMTMPDRGEEAVSRQAHLPLRTRNGRYTGIARDGGFADSPPGEAVTSELVSG